MNPFFVFEAENKDASQTFAVFFWRLFFLSIQDFWSRKRSRRRPTTTLSCGKFSRTSRSSPSSAMISGPPRPRPSSGARSNRNSTTRCPRPSRWARSSRWQSSKSRRTSTRPARVSGSLQVFGKFLQLDQNFIHRALKREVKCFELDSEWSGTKFFSFFRTRSSSLEPRWRHALDELDDVAVQRGADVGLARVVNERTEASRRHRGSVQGKVSAGWFFFFFSSFFFFFFAEKKWDDSELLSSTTATASY